MTDPSNRLNTIFGCWKQQDLQISNGCFSPSG
jgi:hypothetical protein